MADRVLPIVRLFFPCDNAVIDLSDKKWVLKTPCTRFICPPGVRERFVLEEMWLFAHLTDGLGEYRLSVEMRHEETQTVLSRSIPERIVFTFENRLGVLERAFAMKMVPFPNPGLYEFRLLANYAELEGGRAHLRVLAG